MRLFDVSPFRRSGKIYDYYLKTWHVKDVSPAAEHLKTFKDIRKISEEINKYQESLETL